MDLDEINSVPLDEPQLLFVRDVHDVAFTAFELDDDPLLDHIAHRDDRALDCCYDHSVEMQFVELRRR